MNEDGRHITVAVALDAIALAEHCMGNSNVPVSKDIQRWWRGDSPDEGAVMRRDRLIWVAYRLNKEIDWQGADVLKGKWGDAWDLDVLPELLEAAFRAGWRIEGNLVPNWEEPVTYAMKVIKYEEERNDRD